MQKKEGHSDEYSGFFGKHRIWIAIFTIVGTIVGAGILGIPYVIAKSGVLYGLCLIVAIGIAFLFLNLFAGEVVLRTKKSHQLTGYAAKYLGKPGKTIMAISMFVNIYGALIAYLIGEGETLSKIFGFGDPMSWTLIFFAVSVFIIYKGIKATGKMELYLISLLLLVVIIIGVFSFKNLNGDYFTVLNWGHLFLPYGVILFAFIGSPGIPEAAQVLGNQRKKLKKAIIFGSLIPIVLYVIFSLIIVGVVGLDNFSLLEPNERIATVALSLYSHVVLGIFANILAVLSMFTSFLTLGLALVQTYNLDLGLPRKQSLILTFALPLIVAMMNLTSFIVILGVTGTIAGGLDGILITLMYWKAKKKGDRKPEYQLKPHYILGTVLIGMFLIGIGFQIWQLVF